MNYPFEFKELLLTDFVLTKLGFTPYHDGAGDYGDRRLDLGKRPYFEIIEIDAKDDVYDGYGITKEIGSGHYTRDCEDLYFLHELYEEILSDCTVDEVNVFVEKCKEANCYPYLESYLEYKAF